MYRSLTNCSGFTTTTDTHRHAGVMELLCRVWLRAGSWALFRPLLPPGRHQRRWDPANYELLCANQAWSQRATWRGCVDGVKSRACSHSGLIARSRLLRKRSLHAIKLDYGFFQYSTFDVTNLDCYQTSLGLCSFQIHLYFGMGFDCWR